MGIMSLCVSFDPSYVKCKKLYKLDISNTGVTCRGAQVAIENIKHLTFLDFPDICEAVCQARKNCDVYTKDDLPSEQILNLRYLTISQMKQYMTPIPHSVKVAVLVCPFITEVHFMRGATDKCVTLLSELQHLHVLHIGNSDEEFISFEDGILPLLQTRGNSLLDLSLHEVNKIDLGLIAALCQNLKKFSCLIAGYPVAEFPMHTHPEIIASVNHDVFSKLEQVKLLIHTPENTFPAQYVKILTVNAVKLRELHFAFVHSLTDTVLDFILNANKFEHLENCYFESCNKLSGDSINQLIDVCQVMKSLVLKYCNEITRQDFAQYCKFCRDNNFEMNIEWM